MEKTIKKEIEFVKLMQSLKNIGVTKTTKQHIAIVNNIQEELMKNKDKNKDEIEIVVMNPECIPAIQEKLFDFFYEKFVRNTSDK